jgi:hypothetical protein
MKCQCMYFLYPGLGLRLLTSSFSGNLTQGKMLLDILFHFILSYFLEEEKTFLNLSPCSSSCFLYSIESMCG